jgi:hypothetical protein
MAQAGAMLANTANFRDLGGFEDSGTVAASMTVGRRDRLL